MINRLGKKKKHRETSEGVASNNPPPLNPLPLVCPNIKTLTI